MRKQVKMSPETAPNLAHLQIFMPLGGMEEGQLTILWIKLNYVVKLTVAGSWVVLLENSPLTGLAGR